MSDFSVPYTDFAKQNDLIKGKLLQACESVIDSGRYINGPEVSDFEKEFADFCDTKFAVGTANGTCALHLSLGGLGLQAGDEVITAPNSFIASASSIALAGGRPTFADIGEDLNIDPDEIERAITPRTRAIMPVHLTGRPAQMVQIMEIADKHGLVVIEDAAQAVGARLRGKPVGGWGDVACFSLHPLKNLHAFGDGGIATTDDAKVVKRLQMARNHGLQNRDQCDFWSYNCRLDEIQAAMLRIQLSVLEQWTEERRKLAFRYNDLLSPFVSVPVEGPGERCVYQTYVIQAERRDALCEHLVGNGIEALVHYETPIHLQPAAKDLGYSADDFPVAMRACERILSLPLYPGMPLEHQDRVVELIGNFYGSGA
jgi:dTDP-4-amino-4,6-dideoxygalactose transaminase